jgi:phosphatidylserine decarboxylase
MIAPEGWPFVLIPVCVGALAWRLGWPWVGGVLIVFGLFALLFFRDPERSCAADQMVACSPADGKVISIVEAPPELVERGLPRQISVFMSVFNVHVNRAAITGTLEEYAYVPGRKISAFKDKASLENEQNLSIWEGPAGRVGLKQIAGLVARRIVFDHEVGASVGRGQRIGLIRYGSRVDVFLPADAEILVALGESVRAGETPMARLTGKVLE